jgi:SAM-dependent methyltransferase
MHGKDTMHICSLLTSIRQRRHRDPEFKRRQVMDSAIGIVSCDYEWLKPLQPYVDSIADFGCWDTASEAIALRWILKATRVVVIDKCSKHIDTARDWLETTRAGNPSFENCIKEPEFVIGDVTEDELQDKLQECDFDLSYFQDVLYNMKDDSERLQKAINAMARVVKLGEWVIAYERKIHRDISQHFRDAGLVRDSLLDDVPLGARCYRKKLSGCNRG